MLLVGTEVTTVYRSENGGKSFTELKVPAPQGVVKMNFPTRVLRIAVAPQNPDEIYVALEVGGMVRSLDGGKTWVKDYLQIEARRIGPPRTMGALTRSK